MYIRRECLERVGAFDADRFGRGYGEENDFCMRAAKADWRSVLAADVFVFHQGAVSFSEGDAR
jgi:GT2 family glycosyltransferase